MFHSTTCASVLADACNQMDVHHMCDHHDPSRHHGILRRSWNNRPAESLHLQRKDLAIARKRLDKAGHTLQGRLRLRHIKEITTSKHFWIVVLVDIFFWNAGANSGAFLLWLKSLNKYDSATVNNYGTIPSALGIFLVLLVNFSSDLLWGPVWGITFASGMNTLSNLILVSLEVHEIVVTRS